VPVRRAAGALLLLLFTPACDHISGKLVAAGPLGSWAFEPTRCTVSTFGNWMKLSSRTDPSRYVSIAHAGALGTHPREAKLPSILSPSNGEVANELILVDLNTKDTAPQVVRSSDCRVLRYETSSSYSTSTNDDTTIYYRGTADIDCPRAGNGLELTGHFDFVCPDK
jgi:hypothetical protein